MCVLWLPDLIFFFSSRRRHTISDRDWSSDVCSSDLTPSFVVGIALADVHYPPLSADFNLGVSGIGDSVDFWVPEFRDPSRRDNGDLDVIARLRSGVSLEQAQAEMDTISRNLAAAYPKTNNGLTVQVVPHRDQVLGGSRRVLLLLFACTGFVL